jgi:hypothetical protein
MQLYPALQPLPHTRVHQATAPRGESVTTASSRSLRKNVTAISLPARWQSTDSQRTVERDLTENVTFPRKKSAQVQEPDLSAQGESSTAQERDQNIRLNDL